MSRPPGKTKGEKGFRRAPRLLTPAIQESILSDIALGTTGGCAARRRGIPAKLWKEWREAAEAPGTPPVEGGHRKFFESVKRAESEFQQMLELSVASGVAKDPKLAYEVLKDRYPDWGAEAASPVSVPPPPRFQDGQAAKSRLTPALVQEICRWILEGSSRDDAALLAGVRLPVAHKWFVLGGDGLPGYVALLDAVERAEAVFRHGLLQDVRRGKPGWQGPAWILERRFRGEYGKPGLVPGGGESSSPVTVEINMVARDEG